MSIEFGLFQLHEKERATKGDDPIIMVALDKLVPFTPYPFKLYEGETLDKLVNSIMDEGLLTPIVVRPIRNRDGYFEVLSGHNRANVARLLEHSMIEAVIRDDLNDEFMDYKKYFSRLHESAAPIV